MRDIFGGSELASSEEQVRAPTQPEQEVALDAVAETSHQDEPGELTDMLDWQDRIHVPDVDFNIDNETLSEIQSRFNPLSGSRREHGVGVLRDLLSFLQSVS